MRRKRIVTPPWKYYGDEITTLDSMPKGVIGFVYRINFKNGKFYIGKKNLYSVRTIDITKHKPLYLWLDETQPKKANLLRIVKESDWQYYRGSATICKTEHIASREILQFARSKYELTYLEAKYQFHYNVLEHDKAYNDNILGKFYQTNLYPKETYLKRSSTAILK